MSIDEKLEKIMKENVIEAFDAIADSYSNLRTHVWKNLKSLFEDLALKRGIILDIGADGGRNAFFFCKKKMCDILALDVSLKMLLELKRRAIKKRCYVCIHCIVSDAMSLPIRDNAAQLITMIAVLHNIPLSHNRIRALNESRRVLKVEGHIVLSVWSLFQPKLFLKALYIFLSKKLFEFGDVYIPWKHKGKMIYRFYHLFSLHELTKNIKKTYGLRIMKRVVMRKGPIPRNYILVLKNEKSISDA